jgi:hypothetical protein
MRDKRNVAYLNPRASEIRVISEGIFDTGEREILLQFVDEFEKMDRVQRGRRPARTSTREVR